VACEKITYQSLTQGLNVGWDNRINDPVLSYGMGVRQLDQKKDGKFVFIIYDYRVLGRFLLMANNTKRLTTVVEKKFHFGLLHRQFPNVEEFNYSDGTFIYIASKNLFTTSLICIVAHVVIINYSNKSHKPAVEDGIFKYTKSKKRYCFYL
jgi:hypothetical protein